MAWKELHIKTSGQYADHLGDDLITFGAEAITLRDANGESPVYEPRPDEIPTWPETTLISLFDASTDLTPVLVYLHSEQNAGSLTAFHLEDLADQEWERVCLQDFKPLRFGKRLWICPSWENPPEPNAVNVILDPGLAFGTGTSPTTGMCLTWLDQHCMPGIKVMDYGCGSGILAIAALKLGAKEAVALDYDPQAIIATKENGLRNQLSHPLLQVYLPEHFSHAEFDLVIANILASSLMELSEKLTELTKTGGHILLSGILREQVPMLLKQYGTWFDMDEPCYEAEWARLTGKKR